MGTVAEVLEGLPVVRAFHHTRAIEQARSGTFELLVVLQDARRPSLTAALPSPSLDVVPSVPLGAPRHCWSHKLTALRAQAAATQYRLQTAEMNGLLNARPAVQDVEAKSDAQLRALFMMDSLALWLSFFCDLYGAAMLAAVRVCLCLQSLQACDVLW